MKKVFHKADTRGYANHEWLEARHSFSFGNYQNPERMRFGVLRVLNDDRIAGGQGFGMHPHDNMEIITIPLEGDLEHKDNMGNSSVIKEGDVQVMSAGSGVYHSEFNHHPQKDLRLFQIWLFPNKKNVEPRYDEISIRDVEKENEFYQILSPNPDDQGVWIHQNAWFSMAKFTVDTQKKYTLKRNGNGVYLMNIEGEVQVGETTLKKRDALGVWDLSEIEIFAKAGTKILLMEVPMQLN